MAEAEEAELAALGIEGGGHSEPPMAGRRNIESVKGAEVVLEALKTLSEEAGRKEDHAKAMQLWAARQQQQPHAAGGTEKSATKPPTLVPNMLLLGLDEGAYLLRALSSVRSTELEQALLLLPFNAASSLLTRLLPLVSSAPPAELMARSMLFLLRVHHKQLMASHGLLRCLHELDGALRLRLAAEQAAVGFNLAAMRFTGQRLEHERRRVVLQVRTGSAPRGERAQIFDRVKGPG